MPCYDDRDHDPRYICQGERERADKAERDLLGMTQKAEWLTAALCLMTHPDVTSVATSQFLKYIKAIKPELWKESGIRANDLLAWKDAHTAEDIKRRALEKLTPEERKVLGAFMTKFATWGAAMESLDKAIAAEVKFVWDSTDPSDRPSKFYKQEVFIVHRAFQRWCEKHGIDPVKMRMEMVACRLQGNMFGLMNPLRMEKLLVYVPVEFSVRGTWTPLDSTD